LTVMRRDKRYYWAVLLALFFLNISFAQTSQPLSPAGQHQLRLGSFNIEKLGKNNSYQAQNAAIILKDYDIVAIQEVMNTGATKKNPIGTKGIEALKKIISSLGDDWAYVISPEPNGTSGAQNSGAFNTFEYYAFIYRKSKVDITPNSAHLWDESKNPIAGVKNPERQFDREPFIASFKAKNGKLDFTLITIHAAAPDAKWRKDEIRRLKIVYEKVQDEDPNQNDIFLLGDFNTNVDKSEWQDLKSIEAMEHILTSKDITTLNKKEGKLSNSQYDTIWYQGKFSGEDVIFDTAQVHQAWKDPLKHPNVKPNIDTEDKNRKLIWFYGKYTSDHLPVTVILWTDKDTDYFKNSNFTSKQEKEISKEQGKSISELGVVYKGMPKEYLENAGFTKYLQTGYRKEGSKEWTTFSDWTTSESGDTITFVTEDGKVKDWVRKREKKEVSGQDI
jgi:endonuclease/exonuclease/phosphatase family metal-dependent hydrolase